MMRKKHNSKVIKLHLFPFGILVSIGESDKAFQAAIQEYCSPEVLKEFTPEDGILSFSPTCQGRTAHLKPSNVTIIRLAHPISTPRSKGVLAHEIFHAVDMILRTMGFTLSRDSDEAYAYTIQYLTEQIYTQFKIK